ARRPAAQTAPSPPSKPVPMSTPPASRPTHRTQPDAKGFFGKFGGSFIPPEPQRQMDEINHAYLRICRSHDFIRELRSIRTHFPGRPAPFHSCKNLSDAIDGARTFLKREDRNHTGAHRLNHCVGEALLAKFRGKKKLIAETGAGQH